MKIHVLLFILTLSLFASSERKIIIGSFSNTILAKKAFTQFQSKLDNDFSDLQTEYGFNVLVRASGRSYIIVLEPFRNYKEATTIKGKLPEAYADAFINKYTVPEPSSVISILKAKELEVIETIIVKEVAVTEPIEVNITQNNVSLEKNVTIEMNSTVEENTTVDELPSVAEVEEPTLVITKSIEKYESSKTTPIKEPLPQESTLSYIEIILSLIVLIFVGFVFKLYKNNKILKKKVLEVELMLDESLRENEDLINTLKSKDIFLENLSANLKVALDSILNATDLLVDVDFNRREHESFEKIKASALKVNEVINNIIDISKLRSNRLELESIHFNLNNVLETAINSVHSISQEKRVEITFDIDTNLPIEFIGDPLRMNQIMSSLLHQSIDNTHEGELTISIKEATKFDNFMKLDFTIKDTGIGYKQDDLDKIFQDFTYNGSSSTDSGTKVGLVMSKHLINKMGGDIELQSDYGNGSKFIFNIDLELPQDIELRKYRLPYKNIMNYSTVIIDNNIMATSILRKQLEYFQLKVQPSFSWEHANKIINNEFNTFDFLIINSTILGEISIDELSASLKDKVIQVVFIVHDMRDINYQIIDKFKYTHFLHKPYTQKKLFDLLVKIHESNLKRS